MKTFEERIITNILDLSSKIDLTFSLGYELGKFFNDNNKAVTEDLKKLDNIGNTKIYDISNTEHYNKDLSIFTDDDAILLDGHIYPIHMGMSVFFTKFDIDSYKHVIVRDMIVYFNDAIRREDYKAAAILKRDIIKYWTLTEKKYLNITEELINDLVIIFKQFPHLFIEYGFQYENMLEQFQNEEYDKVSESVDFIMSDLKGVCITDMFTTEEKKWIKTNTSLIDFEQVITVLKFALDFNKYNDF